MLNKNIESDYWTRQTLALGKFESLPMDLKKASISCQEKQTSLNCNSFDGSRRKSPRCSSFLTLVPGTDPPRHQRPWRSASACSSRLMRTPTTTTPDSTSMELISSRSAWPTTSKARPARRRRSARPPRRPSRDWRWSCWSSFRAWLWWHWACCWGEFGYFSPWPKNRKLIRAPQNEKDLKTFSRES